ncbi:MAG TPA: carboxypeptidase regulatory-like domain-containing protein [Vicinamibacterales bacterium]|nr:carboxypeptidase regulatory-like domain-containing protein [Vicinamibacterales bacterium]
MKRLLNATLWLGSRTLVLGVLCVLALPVLAAAQGVTTGSLSGVVKDAQEKPVAGATVLALHVPSGTTYEATTRPDGRYSIPGMRVGGPYSVTVAPAAGAAGFEAQTQDDVMINLGVGTDLDFIVRSIAVEVTVTAPTSDAVFSSERTGAATQISREALATLPTFQGRLQDVTRLTPQSGGGMTFAGQDNRLNNITVDGSYFNNSFGLGGTPGDRTGVAPISLEAVEQVQVNIAPYDVRQGNFVGASVNTVTRSGTNQYRGSLYHQFRDEGLVGTEAMGARVNPGTFSFRNTGGWASGPIVKNRAFVFVNYEDETFTQPGTTFVANAGGQPVGGNVTRVLATDLNRIQSRLQSQFGYETGPYEGYEHQTPATRFLPRLDWNISQRNKLSFRYTHLDSFTDVPLSTSSSLGFGRSRNTNFLNFQNSNYQIMENIRSGIGELNSILSDTMANSLIIGYTKQDESRASRGTMFPFVDILEASTTYTSFGFEPFTPNNELRYNTFQVQNNLSWFRGRHNIAAGVSIERYESENVFFPGSQSVYVYNSLNDFFADIDHLQANPNRTQSPITLRRFQVRWANIPGMEKPVQPLEVLYWGAYVQDNFRVRDNLTLNAGIRFDVPNFGDTAFANANADALTFRDEAGNPVQYSTGKLPDARLHWSPRVGFNWDVFSNRQTQLRGGTGVFTGRPAYVWISNQIGNTGVLTGFEEINNTRNRPFHPDPNRYKPANVTGAPASAFELALTDSDFQFPQVWRSNIAVDHRLPWGWTGTAEFMYGRDVNGIYYINANLAPPNSAFVGPDARPRWVGTNANRIHSHVSNAVVLKNQDVGRMWDVSVSAEKNLARGLWMKTAYRYGESKNTVDPGSIAFGSWNNNPHAGDPNNPGLAFANASPGHRFFVVGSYTAEYFSFGKTTFSLFFDSFTQGNTSYTFSGDLNGDGGTSNDLIYVPRNTSEMNFQTFTASGRTFTAAEQAAAWEAYIAQDPYLSKRRGQYAERGAVFLPMVRRVDASLMQDIFRNMGGRRHSLQFRADILNFGNLLNSDWGVGRRLVSNQPLLPQAQTATSGVAPLYRLRVVNNELMSTTFERTAFISDVWRVQFGFRYTFN